MFNFIKKKKDTPANRQKNQQNAPLSSNVKHSLLSLEQRLMFDAAAAATASEVASEQVAQEQAVAAVSGDASHETDGGENGGGQDVVQALTNYMPEEKCVEVAFVDPTVPNYQEMLAGLDPHIEVIMLDGGQDGVEQMAEALSGRSGIDAIHLISHGSSGELQLGTGALNAQSMSGEYANALATIRESLSDHADVLVYGCNFAEGSEGADAVNLLAELTGADVAASTDQTGHIDLGGDWEFEVQVGSIETDIALTDSAQMSWAGVLGTETVADTFSDKSYGNNDGTRSWSTTWSEVDVGASEAKGGHIKVNSGEVRIETQVVGASVSRGVDLSGASSATLSFDYNNDLDKGGSVEIRVSTDGGANYRTLDGGIFSKTCHTGSGTVSFDISDHLSSNTKIQFVVTGTSGGDRLSIDNIHVDYHVEDANTAPSDLALSANTVAENATTGTVVGTVTGTDVGVGDTKTYSPTDTAGGRFAIDPTTGVLTVADGSLLNYEAAASHTVTVQVTDSGGQHYSESVTVKLSNVDEGPTNPTPSVPTEVEPVPPELVVEAAAEPMPDGEPEPEVVVDSVPPELVVEAAAEPMPDGEPEPEVVVDSVPPELVVEAAVEPMPDGELEPEVVEDSVLPELVVEALAEHATTGTIQVTDGGGQSYSESFTINLSNVNEGPSDDGTTDGTVDDTAHQLTTAHFGIRDTDETMGPSASRLNLASGPAEDGLRLSDHPSKAIEINTEGPLTVKIITPERSGLSSISEESLKKVVGTRETEQPPNLNERRASDISRDREEARAATAVDADRQEFFEPDDPIENGEESDALKLSATIGLAGVVLQNRMGNKSKLTTLISRSASAPSVPPTTTPPKSVVDDQDLRPNKLEDPPTSDPTN